MAIEIPIPSQSVEVAVSGTSTAFALTLDDSYPQGVGLYLYTANVASWIAQGATPTASAGSGSMYVPANMPIYLDGANGVEVAVIADSATGKASLTPIQRF